MKLIDLLVQELPKRGGWPDGVRNIEMFASGMIFFDGDCAPKELNLPQCSDGWEKGMGRNYTNAVTREQYEAALAAAQQPVWNGEGLPPVGCECEIDASTPHQKITHPEGVVVKIYAHFTHDRGVELAAFVDAAGSIGGVCTANCFRPIRSEADKKRDEAGEAIYRAINWNHGGAVKRNSRFEDYCKAYDAIVAGKVPGVTIK